MDNLEASGQGGEFWVSVSDLMSGLMVVFMFIAVAYITNLAVEYKELKTELYEDLAEEFEEDLPQWGAELDSTTLSVRFKEPDILFDKGEARLKPRFRRILGDFFPRYVKVLRQEKYAEDIEDGTRVISGADFDVGTIDFDLFSVGALVRSMIDNASLMDLYGFTVFPEALSTSGRETVEELLKARYKRTPVDPWAGSDWSIVWLPDTQHYSADNPEIFDAQTEWIVNNESARNIQLVLHEGDLVQNGDNIEQEWIDADAAMQRLDNAGIPYLAAIGNHDYDEEGTADTRGTSKYNEYFGPSRYTGHSWWDGGFYESGKGENSYLLLDGIEGRDYLILNLELFPRQEVIDWADGLLTQYSDRDAIIVTHAYMYYDDTRLEVAAGDQWGPGHGAGDLMSWDGDTHDSEELWQELIRHHDNIIWIQSGHVIGDGTGYRRDFSNDGASIHQVLANYQEPIVADQTTDGGQLRIMTIKPSEAKIKVETYAPHRDASDTESDHAFEVDYQLLLNPA